MKRTISYILIYVLNLLTLCCAGSVFADEKEVVIDTEVPVFQNLVDGESYSSSKDIYVADLSPVNCILMKKGSGSASLGEAVFSGYEEIARQTNLNCINYVKIATVSEAGDYIVYATDIYDHNIAVRFTITAPPRPTPTPSPGSGGGGGGGRRPSGGTGGGISGGGTGTTETVSKPYANGNVSNTGGVVRPGTQLTLGTQTANAQIYYTVDGTTPSQSSILFIGDDVITLEKGQTLKAIAVKNGVVSAVSEWICTESLVGNVLDAENHIVYMQGYPDHTFLPDNNITRAEATTLFARLMKNKMDETQTYSANFSDVEAPAWYANYIGYMQQFGVINGYEDGSFHPDSSITRAEFVTIASRFAENPGGTECDFSDVSSDYWAYSYIAFASSSGWISGYEDHTFRAEQPITRGEVATIVNRMLMRAADETYVGAHPDRIIQFTDLTPEHWAYYNIVEASNEHQYTIQNGKELWN